MDATTFRLLVGFATINALQMKMMDVATAYLYGDLDKEIYMKLPEQLSIPGGISNMKQPCVQSKRSLYVLK